MTWARSLAPQRGWLGIMVTAVACLALLAEGALDLAYAQGRRESPVMIQSVFQSQPFAPRVFDGDLRQLPKPKDWQQGALVAVFDKTGGVIAGPVEIDLLWPLPSLRARQVSAILSCCTTALPTAGC
jgi:hypothetical protein